MRKRLWFATGMLISGLTLWQLHAGAQDSTLPTPPIAPAPSSPTDAAFGTPSAGVAPIAPTAPPPVTPLPPSPAPMAVPALAPPTIPFEGPPTSGSSIPALAPGMKSALVNPLGFMNQLNPQPDKRQEEIQAAREAEQLARQVPANDEDREKIRAAVQEKLNKIFDLQQTRRTEEITAIEARLAKLKETLEKRKQAKETIVSRRLEQLVGGDELSWEETNGSFNEAPGFPAPGTSAWGTTLLPAPVPALQPTTTIPKH